MAAKWFNSLDTNSSLFGWETWWQSSMSANDSCSLYDRPRRRLEEIEAIRRYIVWVNEQRFLEAELLKQKAEDERVAALHYKINN